MKKIFLTIAVSTLLSGCSLQQLAIRSMGGLMNGGFAVLNEEQDLDIAEKSIASNLKLLEAMLRNDPDNDNLLLLTCMGYTSYTIGFVEDQDQNRARLFYLRAKNYGMRFLKRNQQFSSSLDGNLESFTKSLLYFDKDAVPYIFWTALSWGSYVSLSLTDPDAMADLPKVEAMMKFVVDKDDKYFYGGAHFFLGALYGSRPKALGGNPDESKSQFEKCIQINDGKFLLTYVYYARTYSVQIQDQDLFDRLLKHVEETSIDILPEARLSNAIAKKKAEHLRNLINELF
jgi:hypothetical protein